MIQYKHFWEDILAAYWPLFFCLSLCQLFSNCSFSSNVMFYKSKCVLLKVNIKNTSSHVWDSESKLWDKSKVDLPSKSHNFDLLCQNSNLVQYNFDISWTFPFLSFLTCHLFLAENIFHRLSYMKMTFFHLESDRVEIWAYQTTKLLQTSLTNHLNQLDN